MDLYGSLVSVRDLSRSIFEHLTELNADLDAMEGGRGMRPIGSLTGLDFQLPNQKNLILKPGVLYNGFSTPLGLTSVGTPPGLVSVFSDTVTKEVNNLSLSGPRFAGEVVSRAEALDALAFRAQLSAPQSMVLEDVARLDVALMRRLRASFYDYTKKIEEHFLRGALQLAVFGRPMPEIPLTTAVLDSEASFNAFMNQGGFLPVPDEFDLKVPRDVRPGRRAVMIARDVTQVIGPNTNLHRKARFLANKADLAEAGKLKDLVAANAKLDESARAAYKFATEVTGAAVEASSGGGGRLRRFTSLLKSLDLGRYGSVAGVLFSIGLLAFSLNASASEGNEVEASKPTEGDLAALVHNPVARGFFSLAFPNLDLALSLVA